MSMLVGRVDSKGHSAPVFPENIPISQIDCTDSIWGSMTLPPTRVVLSRISTIRKWLRFVLMSEDHYLRCSVRQLNGTTVRYDRLEDGSTRPVLASATNEEAENWGLRTQQESVQAFTRDLLAVAGLAQIDLLAHVGDLSTAASLVLAKLIGEPTRSEAEALGSLPHAADQSHTGLFEIARPLPASPLEWYRRLRNRGHAPLVSYWPEGSIVRTFGRPVGLVLIRLSSRRRARADRRRR